MGSVFKFPPQIAYEVSREALILYAYVVAFADESGLCRSVYSAGAHAGIHRPDADRLLDELIQKGYVSLILERVPMALLGNGGAVLTTMVGCKITEFVAPLRLTRLSPEMWATLRDEAFERDDYTCQYCGERGFSLELDHVEPISRGGTNELGNLITACSTCNKSKRAKLISEWREGVRDARLRSGAHNVLD